MQGLAAEGGRAGDEVGIRRGCPTPTVRPVAQDRETQVGEVHPDLVGTARPQLDPEERQRHGGGKALEHAVARHGRAPRSGGTHGHAPAVSRVPPDRRLDDPLRARHRAVDQRQIPPFDTARLELSRQGEVRAVGLGDNEEARGPAVQPVDDPGAAHAPDPGERRATARQEGVDERPRRMTRPRVDDQARGLVHDKDGVVLVDDIERNRLGHERERRRGRNLDGDRRAGAEALARLGTGPIHDDVACRDQGLQVRARQVGRAGLEEAVEPRPGLAGRDREGAPLPFLRRRPDLAAVPRTGARSRAERPPP